MKYPHNYHTSYPPNDLTIDSTFQIVFLYFYQISYEITENSNVFAIIAYLIQFNAAIT